MVQNQSNREQVLLVKGMFFRKAQLSCRVNDVEVTIMAQKSPFCRAAYNVLVDWQGSKIKEDTKTSGRYNAWSQQCEASRSLYYRDEFTYCRIHNAELKQVRIEGIFAQIAYFLGTRGLSVAADALIAVALAIRDGNSIKISKPRQEEVQSAQETGKPG